MQSSAILRTPLYITASDDNFSDNTYTDESLAGWTYSVEEIGNGTLFPNKDYTTTDTSFTVLGDNIADGRRYVLHFISSAGNVFEISSISDYSNSFNTKKVLAALINRVKFRNVTRKDFTINLSYDNVWDGPDSQLMPVFESEHKVISPYYIWKAQDDANISENDFNQYLFNMRMDAIKRVLPSVFNETEIIEQALMYERLRFAVTVPYKNTSKFCGVRLRVAPAFDIAVSVDYAILYFDSDVSFNLYLFNDTHINTPLCTIPVSAVANTQTLVDISTIISYVGQTNKGGDYYLGYYQDDLGDAMALNEPVGKLNNTRAFSLMPVEMIPNGTGIVNTGYSMTLSISHGLNLQVTSFKDFTQLIINRPSAFDNLIKLQMCNDVIELIQMSSRTNRDVAIMGMATSILGEQLTEDGSKDKDIRDRYSMGLRRRIQVEVDRIRKTFYPKPFISYTSGSSYDGGWVNCGDYSYKSI